MTYAEWTRHATQSWRELRVVFPNSVCCHWGKDHCENMIFVLEGPPVTAPLGNKRVSLLCSCPVCGHSGYFYLDWLVEKARLVRSCQGYIPEVEGVA